MEIDRLIRMLQDCADEGYTEVELVINRPDSRHRNEYDVASLEYASPVVYIHADYEY